MSSQDLGILGMFVVIGLTTMISLMAKYWFKHRRLEMETALKQDMVNRGMSAEDIERVLLASTVKDCEASSKKV
jgi:hypothetical protein